jgi:E3 ubiquitin-protein ligase TRIP12
MPIMPTKSRDSFDSAADADRMIVDEENESSWEDAEMDYGYHGIEEHYVDDEDAAYDDDEGGDEDGDGDDDEEHVDDVIHPHEHQDDDDDEEEEEDEDDDDEDEDDEDDEDNEEDQDEDSDIHSGNARRTDLDQPSRIRNVFSALSSGLLSGFSSRIKPIVTAIKNRDDPSAVLMGLQELADNLLVSTEDALIGYFPVDEVAEELVRIMRDPMYEDNPEIMLMACRNISNLIEALPSSVASIVHTDAISVLCHKLLEIQYIDLAEQALAVSCQQFVFF